jgi:nucleotide-binding universal stress UspA family protein
MEKIKKILAPADLSTLSKGGIRYALEFAGSQGAEVIVCNVITPEETPFPQAIEEWVAKQGDLPQVKRTIEDRKRRLAEFMKENFADYLTAIKVRQDVEIGTPYKRIVEKAEEEGVDMIIMCTHGRTGLLHMLIGSVTEQVVRRAPCAVLSVRPSKATPAHEAES